MSRRKSPERGARAALDARAANEIIAAFRFQQDFLRAVMAAPREALNVRERAVLPFLALHVDHEGQVCAGEERIAHLSGQSTRNLRNVRKGLVMKGWITHELVQNGPGFKRSLYRLTVPGPIAEAQGFRHDDVDPVPVGSPGLPLREASRKSGDGVAEAGESHGGNLAQAWRNPRASGEQVHLGTREPGRGGSLNGAAAAPDDVEDQASDEEVAEAEAWFERKYGRSPEFAPAPAAEEAS